MNLIPIPASHIDRAWAEGASCLARACDTSGGEIEGPQLKMLLARGERTLLKMVENVITEQGARLPDGSWANYEERTVGWGVVRVDQLPNMRVLFITDLVAPHGGFQRFFSLVCEIAKAQGCSRVRCAAKPAQARLYKAKVGFRPVYEILEAEV